MTEQEKYDHLFKTGNFIKYVDKILQVYSYGNDSEFMKPPETCPWVRLIDFGGYIMSMIFENGNRNVLSVIEPITEAGAIETYNLLFKTAEKKRQDRQEEDKEQLLAAKKKALSTRGTFVKIGETTVRVSSTVILAEKDSTLIKSDSDDTFMLEDFKGNVFTFDIDEEIINGITLIDSKEEQAQWLTLFNDAKNDQEIAQYATGVCIDNMSFEEFYKATKRNQITKDAEPPVIVIPDELKKRLSKKGSYVVFKNDICVVHRAISKYFDTEVDSVVLVRGHDGMHITIPLVDETISDFTHLDKLPFLPNGGILPDASITLEFHIGTNTCDDEKFKGYFRNALRLLDVQVDNPRILETLIRAYEGIKEKGGGFQLSDASEILAALVKKYPEEVIMSSAPEKPEPLPEITPDFTPAPIKLPNSSE